MSIWEMISWCDHNDAYMDIYERITRWSWQNIVKTWWTKEALGTIWLRTLTTIWRASTGVRGRGVEPARGGSTVFHFKIRKNVFLFSKIANEWRVRMIGSKFSHELTETHNLHGLWSQSKTFHCIILIILHCIALGRLGIERIVLNMKSPCFKRSNFEQMMRLFRAYVSHCCHISSLYWLIDIFFRMIVHARFESNLEKF